MLRRTFAFATIHLLLMLLCFGLAAGSAMSRLDTGAPRSVTARAASAVSDLLLLPLAYPGLSIVGSRALPGGWAYAMIILNSVIWGVGLAWMVKVLRRRSRPGLREKRGNTAATQDLPDRT
jgi:hypothetical protein